MPRAFKTAVKKMVSTGRYPQPGHHSYNELHSLNNVTNTHTHTLILQSRNMQFIQQDVMLNCIRSIGQVEKI